VLTKSRIIDNRSIIHTEPERILSRHCARVEATNRHVGDEVGFSIALKALVVTDTYPLEELERLLL
jgi:hypothetical protein